MTTAREAIARTRGVRPRRVGRRLGDRPPIRRRPRPWRGGRPRSGCRGPFRSASLRRRGHGRGRSRAAAYAANAAALAAPDRPGAIDGEISWQLANLTA